jgi:hypothetical protein
VAQHQNFFFKKSLVGRGDFFVAKSRNFWGKKRKKKKVPSNVIKEVFEKIFKKVATFGGKKFRNCQDF